jgi:rubrerythrin
VSVKVALKLSNTRLVNFEDVQHLFSFISATKQQHESKYTEIHTNNKRNGKHHISLEIIEWVCKCLEVVSI